MIKIQKYSSIDNGAGNINGISENLKETASKIPVILLIFYSKTLSISFFSERSKQMWKRNLVHILTIEYSIAIMECNFRKIETNSYQNISICKAKYYQNNSYKQINITMINMCIYYSSQYSKVIGHYIK